MGKGAATLVEDVLAGEIGTEEALDEAAWHRLWERDGLAGKTPLEMALAGGALADRLSWVFVSGYQAALHANFPQLPRLAGPRLSQPRIVKILRRIRVHSLHRELAGRCCMGTRAGSPSRGKSLTCW